MLRAILLAALLALGWATASAAADLAGTQAGANYGAPYNGTACDTAPAVGQVAITDTAQGQCGPVVINQSPRVLHDSLQFAQRCCKVCKKGKACGNSCINRSYTCHQPPGCACDG